jgi:hypothetical protein
MKKLRLGKAQNRVVDLGCSTARLNTTGYRGETEEEQRTGRDNYAHDPHPHPHGREPNDRVAYSSFARRDRSTFPDADPVLVHVDVPEPRSTLPYVQNPRAEAE